MSRKIKKIFIVDDDEMLSIALEDFLTRKTQHKISLFNTGEDCLRCLAEEPDIIILDYNLNSVYKNAANGMKILESIKKEDRSIRVIMLSSQEAYGTALQTITRGAEEYVIKSEDAFKKIAELCEA